MKNSPFRHIDSIFYKRQAIQLTFFLTKRCNARCPFCFYLSEDLTSSKEKPQIPGSDKELALSEIERISLGFGHLLWLAFSGGEIFLRQDLPEITEIFYKNNNPAIILFPTNGLLSKKIRENMETIASQCPKSTIVVKLSLDGPQELHDRLRGVQGAYRKVLRTYELLEPMLEKYPNLELGINTLFCSQNQHQMDDIFNEVKKFPKIGAHTVSMVRGSVNDKSLKEIDRKLYAETIARMEDDLKKKVSARYSFSGARLKAAQDILQRRYIHRTLQENKRLISCYAGRLNLVLTETGELFPCEEFSLSMGKVQDFDYNIRNLLKGAKARKVLSFIRDKGCYCTHECYFMTNILFNPRLYPELFKEYHSLGK